MEMLSRFRKKGENGPFARAELESDASTLEYPNIRFWNSFLYIWEKVVGDAFHSLSLSRYLLCATKIETEEISEIKFASEPDIHLL